jgi:hypothetical protein
MVDLALVPELVDSVNPSHLEQVEEEAKLESVLEMLARWANSPSIFVIEVSAASAFWIFQSSLACFGVLDEESDTPYYTIPHLIMKILLHTRYNESCNASPSSSERYI